MDDREILIIGAGPVGLATALLLASEGRWVTVFEARDEIPLDDANSYPIGVNLRGQRTLQAIHPTLLEDLKRSGATVAGFKIRAGRRVVASLESGTLIGTTRARLTGILLAAARREGLITIRTGHRLRDIDLDARILVFETAEGEVEIEAGRAIVVAADGVRSRARQAMVEQRPGSEPRVGEWGLSFRVLYSQPGASAPRLDPAWHHIFTSKGIYTATLPGGTWCIAVTAVEGDEVTPSLLAAEASDANVAALRRYLHDHAPLVKPLLAEQDLRDFFSREPLSGAVVCCPRLVDAEWLVLLGDAAHSVIPPTGEGVNAGLEDALLFSKALASSSATPLADYERDRLPDLDALGSYAWHLRDNIIDDDPLRTVANIGLRVAGSLRAIVGRRDALVEERLFGPEHRILPYREAIGPWLALRERWHRRILGAGRRTKVHDD